MLHSLAYKQFVDSIEQCGYRHLVYTKRVNPAWTSWLAKSKILSNHEIKYPYWGILRDSPTWTKVILSGNQLEYTTL